MSTQHRLAYAQRHELFAEVKRLEAINTDLLAVVEIAWTKADWSAVDGDTMNEVADTIAKAREYEG